MDKILQILEEMNQAHDYAESRDFLEDGMLDSFDVIELVSRLEDVFHCKIDGLDIMPENFCNLEAIEKTVKKNGGTV